MARGWQGAPPERNDLLEMNPKKRKRIFHLVGIAVVASWLVMVGFLVKKVHFMEQPEGPAYEVSMGSIESAQREWKEIFIKNHKVGYAVNLIKPFGDGYYIQEEIFLRLNLMGLGSGVYVVTQSRVDKKFLLQSFEFGMTSGVVSYRVWGNVEDGALMIHTGKGKEKRTQRIRLERPPMMGAGMGYYFRNKKLKVGETFHLPLFDPSAMSQREITIKVAAREAVTVNNISYDTFRLEGQLWGKAMTFWVDAFGAIIKETGFMGLTTIKSSAAKAPRDLEKSGEEDFYDYASIKVDRLLPPTERLHYLKLRVEGMDPEFAHIHHLNRGRQSYRDGVLEIRKEKKPFRAPYRLPYAQADPDMRPFVEPEFNIESDSREIQEKAREIRGNDESAVSSALKLMDWVYGHIEKRPVVSVPSALEVLRTRVGDCNEHATLLTALLRASGIPARISIGLVYTRDKFFYHAWTEAFLGRWVSMDATTNQMPSDVTHIKLIEGNLDKQVEIVALMGQLRKIQILDYE